MHPLKAILSRMNEVDFAVLWHGFTEYGRDYLIIIEDCLGGDPGQHQINIHTLRSCFC